MTFSSSFFEVDYWKELESEMIEMVKDALILLKSELKDQMEKEQNQD